LAGGVEGGDNKDRDLETNLLKKDIRKNSGRGVDFRGYVEPKKI
jgi:hypothetical protein